MNNRFSRALTRAGTVATALALLTIPSWGQTADTYNMVVGTDVLDPMGSATNIGVAANDDAPYAGVPLGFNFPFEGAPYSHVSVAPDGWFRLQNNTTTAASDFSNSLSDAGGGTPRIAPWHDDLALGGAGNGGLVRYQLNGVSPNQVFIIEWFVTMPRSTSGTPSSRFQCWLHENGQIDFVYGAGATGTSPSATIGLRGLGAQFLSVTIPANTTSTVTSNNLLTGFNTNLSAITRKLSFTAPPPPACPTPSGVTATNVVFNGATANWSCLGCTGTFIVEYGPSATFTTPGTGATAGTGGTVISNAVSPQAITGLVQNTQYRFFVRQDCSNSSNGFSANSAGVLFTTLLPPPANDDCVNAIPLGSCPSTPVIGSTLNSTVDAGYTSCGAGGSNTTERGVWYLYPGDNNAVTVTTCASTGYDSRLTVFSGSCGALVCEGGNDDATCTFSGLRSSVTFNAYTGTNYYIFVHGYQFGTALSATGNFELSFTCAALCLPLPGNDLCANAQPLALSTPASGTNQCAAATVGNPTCESAFSTLPDVFYSFVATSASMSVTVTHGTITNTGLAVYDACGGVEVACFATLTSGSANSITGLTPSNTYYIRMESDQGSEGTFTIQVDPPPPPPANDECAAAVALTVNPDYSCGSVTNGTIAYATASADANTCGGTDDDDVWYTFVATATAHRVSLINITGGTSDLYMAISSGACGSQTSVLCSDPETANLTGLTIGTTYTVRVYSWTATPGQTSVFDICVGTPPPPPANDECINAVALTVNPDYDCGTVTNGTIASATASADANTCGGTDDDDVWYTFVATATAHRVSLINITGGTSDLYMAISSGACGSQTSVLCSDPETANLTGLTIGTTYTVRVYSWTSTPGQTSVFDICVGTQPPPPANDDCVNAIMVNCNSLTPGTTIGGNGADNPGATCGTSSNTTPGVWYTVTGWGGSMTASLCGSTTTDTKMQVLTGACGAFTCVAGNDDACSLQSAVTWASTAGTTYYIYVYQFSGTSGYNFVLEVACGDENPPCSENTVTMSLETDSNGGQTSYEITPIGISTPVCTGSGFSSNSSITETCCLPDGCYRLRVFDSFGDGMTTGGYVLRDGNGDRIIDNDGNGANFTFESSIANNGSFCLPLSTDRLLDQNTTGGFGCDRMDYTTNDYLIAKPNPAVGGGTDAYQFWIFDPNGTYTRRVLQTNPANNGWSDTDPNDGAYLRFGWLQTLPVPTDILLNVRIRTRVGGTFGAFGPACRMMVISTPPACPTTMLNDNPNSPNFSCGVTRTFGFSNKVVAFPVAGANLYRFRFENTGEGYLRNITSPTATRILNWGTLPLVDGSTYQVQVQASFDGGATYCPLGPVCSLTIANPPAVANNRSMETTGTLNMWPNPNRGDQLYLTINDLPEQDLMVTVDIFDMYGKRVSSRSIATQGGLLNTVIELNNELASGLYMVNIAAGEQLFTQRLVIQ